MSALLWLLALFLWAMALGNFVQLPFLTPLSHWFFGFVGPLVGGFSDTVLAVLSIFAGLALIWLAQLFGGTSDFDVVQCESCGWKGSYKKWKAAGGCPVCGSDVYKKVS